MLTNQQKNKQLEDNIRERTEYLRSIEKQIEDFSEIANIRLYELNGLIDEQEKQLALVMKRKISIEQFIRENKHIA